jgi:hypothetical protein
LKFSAEWLHRGDSSAPELSATTALLEISVASRNVSAFLDRDAKVGRDRIVMPVYPIAEGLARHWWWLTAGRAGTVLPLRRFREGFALPDLWFRPDGVDVHIDVYPINYDNPAVSFYEVAHEQTDVSSFERDAGHFIDNVLDRLGSSGVVEGWLATRWSDVRRSSENEDERLFCEAAGALGIDPYTCNDEQASVVEAAAKMFVGDSLNEFLAAQRHLRRVSDSLSWLSEQEEALIRRGRLPELPKWKLWMQRRIDRSSPSKRPWNIGRDAADILRTHLNLDDERVFGNVSAISTLCGNGQFAVGNGAANGLRASVKLDETPILVVPEFPLEQTRVFAIMRAIGDYLIFHDSGPLSPITEARSHRQAVGRAFAAEFLAPGRVVEDRLRNGATIEQISIERHVSETLIENQLVNLGLSEARQRIPSLGSPETRLEPGL